jgi:hypothetical protein
MKLPLRARIVSGSRTLTEIKFHLKSLLRAFSNSLLSLISPVYSNFYKGLISFNFRKDLSLKNILL